MSNFRLTLLVFCAMLWLPSGCGVFKTELDKCHEAREYQQAKQGVRTQVPDDLQSLSEEALVPMPDGKIENEATPEDEPCLIEPPDYRASE